jgi:hypothetical protein
MGQGKGWVWGLVLGAGVCGGMVDAGEVERPSITQAESVLADLGWIEDALNERAVLLGMETLSSPGSNDFAALKRFCCDLLPYFIDPLHADGEGDFSAYLDAHSGVLPALEIEEVTVRLRMPINYFMYTPAPWGVKAVTNAQTAAGGTAFPSGQTAWTDADYGPAGLRRFIGQMIWTRAMPYWNGGGGEINVRSTGNEWSESWSACLEYAAANWPEQTYHFNCRPRSATTGYMFGEDGFAFSYTKIWNDLEVSNLSTQQAHAIDVYLKCGIFESSYYPVGYFDNQGVPHIRNGYSRIAQMAADFQDRISVRVGDDGDAPLNWCDEPEVDAGTYRGWEAKQTCAVIRWDVPGGLTK